MKWLILSSKVSPPRSRRKMSAKVKRRRKKVAPPSSVRSKGGAGVWKLVLPLLVLAILAGGLWWVFHHSEIFNIREIRVRNHHSYSPEEVIEMSGIETGGNIFALNLASAREYLLRDVNIRDARVERIFPDVIEIEIVEREPRARVQFGHLYTIDDWGVILGSRKRAPERKLPVIRGLRVKGGSLFPVDKREACLRLLRELEEQDIGSLVTIAEIRLFSSDLIEMRTEGDLEITLGRDDYGMQLRRLKMVLDKLGPEVAQAREVDLRYSKIPVVDK